MRKAPLHDIAMLVIDRDRLDRLPADVTGDELVALWLALENPHEVLAEAEADDEPE